MLPCEADARLLSRTLVWPLTVITTTVTTDAAVTQQTAGLETDKVDVGDTNFKYFGYAPLRYTRMEREREREINH